MRLDEIVLVLLFMVMFAMIAYDKGVNDLRDSIKTACTTEGQFTVSGRTYRCGAIKEETIQQSKARKFEQCRAWLHNSERGE
jgi:hypothetical protein